VDVCALGLLNLFLEVLPLLLPNSMEEILESLNERSRNLPSKSNRPTDSNQWTSDADHQISPFLTENLAASAKKGLAKARKELAKARQSIVSLASKATDGSDAENQRTHRGYKHSKAPRSGLVSRAVEASSSIWKMFSGATGAATNIWSKATKWKTGEKLEKDGNAKNIPDPTDFLETEGRSNHGSLDVRLEEYHSWPTRSYVAKENSEQGRHQIDFTQGISAPVEQELVYFVPNPEAPQFVETDFLPSPPDQTDQSQIEEKNLIHIDDTSVQPAIDVFYGEKTDFVTAQTFDHTDPASPNFPGSEFDSQNWLIPASNYLGSGEAENSQLFTSFSSDLTIREPAWDGWGEEDLLPPSELSSTRTWMGERRVGDGRWELPAAEMVAEELVAMEEQENDQEVKEKRIQQLALQLLHDEAMLAEGSSLHEARSIGGRSLASGSGYEFNPEDKLNPKNHQLQLEDGWVGFHSPR
jgi:hypothetical protein